MVVDGGTKTKEKKYKWWHAVLFYVAVSAMGYLSTGNKKKGEKLYEKKQEQAPWAPPAWVFAPAWSINNLFLVWGLMRILNDKTLPERNKMLAQQALIWFIYISFGYVYFEKKSPILAAVWTQADAIVATASFITAQKVDKKLSVAYLPLTLWTWFASSLSDWQAVKNTDPIFSSLEV